MCFRQLREGFGIDAETYMRCLGHTWTTVATPGKSKALLYFAGTQFVIKTLNKDESKFLRSILCGYFKHVANHPTLITKFYGHHCLRSLMTGAKIRFVVMNNVFRTDNEIHLKYDLKGSTFGRSATPVQAAGPDCIFKDNDMGPRRIHIGTARGGLLMQQLRRDVEFLKRMGIMDYSLLLGIHERDLPLPLPSPPSKLSNMCFTSEEGGMVSISGKELYYIGVIDILQDYCLRKFTEHHVRAVFHDRHSISAVPPASYATRFLKFIEDHIE
eukprot:NODE_3557_length_946_cov_15.881563_g3405_i0.p1 GENE.NODE_3557_length_946_cov_15.881563_g3405_i0~~NODE_3557_length_946_cov_15.881563_g3405_i0.p1  ORF type:complete len:297 (+),score=86.04 NODE_3557_length_946_cov_15.881563_g3405_i0:79-891(+)